MPGAIPFDTLEYWSQRFDNEQSFEWLMPWSMLEPRMRALELLPKDPSTAKILNLGCGNSDLPLDLYRSGYQHITSVDFVGSVVDRMRERCEQAIGWPSAAGEAVGPFIGVPSGSKAGASSELTVEIAGTLKGASTGHTTPDVSTLEAAGTLSISTPSSTCSSTVSIEALPSIPSSSTSLAPRPPCPLQFLEMDCLDMSKLPPQSFQLCIDKSTSDAISCGDDDDCTKLRTLCEQVARVVVQPGGLWCVISYSRFRQYEWTEEGLAQGLWRTERIEEIKVRQETSQPKQPRGGERGSRDATQHKVHVPDVFQYLYVNRRL